MILLAEMLGTRLVLAMRPVTPVLLPARLLNANRCAVTKVKREKFTRVYPTMAVLPDGSTITSKHLQI